MTEMTKRNPEDFATVELQRDVEHGVLARDLEHRMGSVLDDAGSGVVVLVDTVAKPHQATLAVLDGLDEGVDVLERTDLVEHGEDRFVGAAVARTVERSAAGCE